MKLPEEVVGRINHGLIACGEGTASAPTSLPTAAAVRRRPYVAETPSRRERLRATEEVEDEDDQQNDYEDADYSVAGSSNREHFSSSSTLPRVSAVPARVLPFGETFLLPLLHFALVAPCRLGATRIFRCL